MTLHTAGVTIDCSDPRTLAPFWIAALGYEVGQDFDGEFLMLQPKGGGAYLAFQRVPEPRVGRTASTSTCTAPTAAPRSPGWWGWVRRNSMSTR